MHAFRALALLGRRDASVPALLLRPGLRICCAWLPSRLRNCSCLRWPLESTPGVSRRSYRRADEVNLHAVILEALVGGVVDDGLRR